MTRFTYKVHDIDIPQANDSGKTISKTVYESETHHAESGMVGFSAPDKTILTGAVVITDSLTVIRGESASNDILNFITFGTTPEINDKDLVWIVQGAEPITIGHNVSTPPANSGPILLLSETNKKMIGTRLVLLQRQGNNFQEIAYDGIVGNGGILVTDDEGNAVIVCGSVPSAVNHLKITNAVTANDVVIEAIGTDPNIGLEIKGKGTKFVQILSLIITQLLDANSLAWGKVNSIVSAVNEFTFSNAATGTDPILEGTGTDTDIGIELKTKGTGVITAINTKITNIRESVDGALAIVITGAASIVNHFEFKPSITTEDLELNALGTDADVGIIITPKGTGDLVLPSNVIHGGRDQQDKGADIVSASIITLGGDGNFFDITGTTTINEILGTDWQNGSEIVLQFDGVLTITNNSGGTNDIITGDGNNITTAAGFVLGLRFNGTDWIEAFRNTVAAGGTGNTFARVVKKVDESVSNSATLQDDDELGVAVSANKTYAFMLVLFFKAEAAQGIKFAFSIPSGAGGRKTDDTLKTNANVAIDSALTTTTSIAGTGGDTAIIMHGLIRVDSTPGNLQFQWAQSTSGGPTTDVKQGSHLILWEELP